MSPTNLAGAFIDQYEEVTANKASGALAGQTVAAKDALVIADGHATTAGSDILSKHNPYCSPYTATVIQKVVEAGGTVVGKTDLDEFAMGSSTESSAFGGAHATENPCVNPWDITRVPGGSSGGSAVAVATRQARYGLGTDTGGSVRQPAAFCGVVGLKPTYGRVSRYGAVAMASSLEQVGVFGTTVADAATLLQVIAGHDLKDATSVERSVPDYVASLEKGVRGLKIGLPKEYFGEGLNAEVETATRQVAKELTQAGAELVDVSLPLTEYAVAVYYIIMPAEGSSNLARYDGMRYGYSAELDDDMLDPASLADVYTETRGEGFGDEVKRRIMLGTYVLSAGYYEAYYRKAMQVRTLITQDFARAFTECDVLLTPTTPTTAFQRGEKIDDPLQMYLNDIYTVSANLAGIPGISVPAGFDAAGLPIGVQLLGPHWGEETILRAAHTYEQQHDWYKRVPPINNLKQE